MITIEQLKDVKERTEGQRQGEKPEIQGICR